MSAILSPVTRSGREQLEQSLHLAAAVAALLIAGLLFRVVELLLTR